MDPFLLPPVPDSKFPPVSLELVEALESRFIDRCPGTEATMDHIRQLGGSVKVVRFLRRIHQQQVEASIATPTL